MRAVGALALKDLRAYFYSPIAYVVLAASLLVNGWTLWLVANALNNPAGQVAGSVLQIFFGGTFFYWFQILLLCPVIAMRLFAEEKKTGTHEILLTAPVTDFEVVVGKFLAALGFYTAMWAPTLIYILLLRVFASVDTGPIYTGYLGTLCVGSLFLSLGLLASSMTKNQIVAAVVSFTASLLIFSLTFLIFYIPDGPWRDLLAYVSLLEHFEDFGKGVVDTRAILFYVTTTVFFLFMTIRILESRKWR